MINAVMPMHSVTYDGATLTVYHANKGQGLPSHSHAYSHLTICNAGSCAVRKEGKELIMTKDTQPVNLLADGWHEIEALEDGTVFVNVFAENKY
jgi:quercetin dioxygenase-like cupin family protein